MFQEITLFVAAINWQSTTVWASPVGITESGDVAGVDNPILGGFDHNRELVLYPCRAFINGDIVPGKAVLGSGAACWVSYDGREYKMTSDYEVLTNPDKTDFRWQASTGIIPAGAVAGGMTSSGETLYVARCTMPQRITPGKLRQTVPNVMYYGYGGAEVSCSLFDVLVK